jgi:hypothetical protein
MTKFSFNDVMLFGCILFIALVICSLHVNLPDHYNSISIAFPQGLSSEISTPSLYCSDNNPNMNYIPPWANTTEHLYQVVRNLTFEENGTIACYDVLTATDKETGVTIVEDFSQCRCRKGEG